MTDRQRAMLDFIREFTAEHGYAPSIREIARAVGITSLSVAHHNLTRLTKHGLIRRAADTARGIVLVGESW